MDDYTNALFLQTSIPSGRYTTQNYIALYKKSVCKLNGKLQYFKLLLFVMYLSTMSTWHFTLFQITMTKRFWRSGIFILKLDIDRPGADNVNSFHFYSSLSLTRYFESMFENYVQRFVWSNTNTVNLLF